MDVNHRNLHLIVSFLLITVALFSSSPLKLMAQAAAPEQPAVTAPKTAEQVYKNIQAFKGQPADQLIPTMQYFTVALGVRCDFCHVNPWDKDAKPEKATARKMIAMVFAVDKDTFNGRHEVTCYTCHRGSAKPVSTPMIPEAAGAPMPAAPAAESAHGAAPAAPSAPLPSADQIFDKYAQALGGAGAIRKVTSLMEKGTFEGGGGFKAPLEIDSKAPDKIISTLATPQGNFAQAYDGSVGWEQEPGGEARDMTGDDLAQVKQDAEFYRPLQMKDDYSRLQVAGVEKIAGHEAYHVLAWKGTQRRELYFDTATGLLVRERVIHHNLIGSMPEQTDYEDYREVDGLKLPFITRVASPDGVQSVTLANVQANVPIDDGKFAKPAEKTPEPPKPSSK